jgi:hypothetical protein
MKWQVASVIIVITLVSASFSAQSGLPDITGTWRAETPDGPRDVIVRPDSSASFGEETVRWRLADDSIHIAFGDEWMVYKYELKRNQLTFSAGDLEEPVDLERVGPATPRPEGVTVPVAPPPDRRALP